MESYQVLEWGQPLQRVLGARPVPSGTEVLVKVRACGVCHSDIHIRDGAYDLGGGKSIQLGLIGIHLPLTMGHEIVGTVVGAGPDARVEIGAEGVVYPWIGCGACRHCLKGEELDCETPRSLGTRRPGGYGQYVLVPHPRYVLPLGNLDPLVAASAACSGLTAYSALKKLPATGPEETIVIIGAGGLGLAALGLVRHLHAGRIVVLDSNPDKLALAASQADAVLDISDPGSGAALRAFAGGGALGVVDFVGLPQTFEWSMAALRKGGTLVEVGLFGGGVLLSIPVLPMRNLRLLGSYVGSLREFTELLALLNRPEVKTVTVQGRPIAEINDIFEDIRLGRVAGRVMALF
ncbi:alcohol dehydrogenase [Piscinibacter koreensis]|uniref:alcohol dehydrogenase n=1 Tax=Piscinibacter koreensis TaxID=2742824 RepID=A0A7Y6NR02_9BURK|nr:alcohol dehydrogenase [Schlegelella koreensis]NUZ07706.1 alcohol dehydrogenase catalytic domain-containing protein [Schlegelella koreensis]